MLHYSFSTMLMAIIATNLLLILLTVCFRSTKAMINAGYKLLALFILFAVLRFILPFELPFRHILVWPDSISKAVWKIHYWVFEISGYPVSIWHILQSIWILGALIKLFQYIISYRRTSCYITLHAKVVAKTSPIAKIMEQICLDLGKPNHFVFIELPGLKTPVLFGVFNPRLLIPEGMQLSERDWHYVLSHEASHHFHHDILMKNVIKFITIVYWWNPFCNSLNRQTDVMLEMRVDNVLTAGNAKATSDYMHCLINVSEQKSDTRVIPRNFTMSLLHPEMSDMQKRFLMLAANQQKRNVPLNILLFSVALAIYVLSYIFIIEAFRSPEEATAFPETIYNGMVRFETGETYAVQIGENTYDIFYEGSYMETVDSLEYYYDITVYTEEDCPYPHVNPFR